MAAVLEKGLSQLDWLWTNYSEIDVGDIALQSQVNELIDEIKEEAVKAISCNILSDSYLLILSYNINGELVSTSTVDMYPFIYTSKDSSTISTNITDNVIYSQIIFGTLDNTVILLDVSDGIAAKLNIADDTEINFDVTNGLKGTIPLLNTELTVKFSFLTMEEYSDSDTEDGTIYFVSDEHCIYLNGLLYTTNEDIVRDFVDDYISLLVEEESDGSNTVVIELTGIRDDIDDLNNTLTWQNI